MFRWYLNHFAHLPRFNQLLAAMLLSLVIARSVSRWSAQRNTEPAATHVAPAHEVHDVPRPYSQTGSTARK